MVSDVFDDEEVDPLELLSVEVYENQRHAAGWHKTVPPDRLPFVPIGDGKGKGVKFLEAVKPPAGYEWSALFLSFACSGLLTRTCTRTVVPA